ncbi:AraC family transcriptional regulator [Thalassospira mesophila]|uniref:AraC family transcriptional regulator n=1 Tax=Thalassospira mesophila TaxID=1293891 RepID=A0A1Y2KY68_9PROT|nr:AraC family transcriptional regulator [Thalassospira mesophila]OSQ37217.1 AraC family transcriptional regulator [Thalassospira mesophila]
MDPLSDVLALLKPKSYMSAGIDIAGPWAIQFPGMGKGIKTGAVVSGDCWLAIDGVADPVHLQTGDCFLLPHGRAFLMGSDLNVEPVNAFDFFAANRSFGHIRTQNGGGDCLVLSSRFTLDGHQADLLLAMLPPIVHIRDHGETFALRHSVERMMEEMRKNEPGSTLVLQNLAHMMLVQALRQHLDTSSGGTGWFFALADKQIGTAIGAIHNAPAHPWTVEALASHAGMSRSAFAAKFKDRVGKSPMAYLTQWRMLLAGERLGTSRDPVSVIALALGYESESAFSTAFKREMGCSPRQYSQLRVNAAA